MSSDKNGIDYTDRLTEQDIILIGDILNHAMAKFIDKGLYAPSALEQAVRHFNRVFNKEMSWSAEEL